MAQPQPPRSVLDADLHTADHDRLLAAFAKPAVLEVLFDNLFPRYRGHSWHILISPQVPVVTLRGEVVGGCDLLAEGFPDTRGEEGAGDAMMRLSLYLMTQVGNIGAVLRELNVHALYEDHLLPYISVLVVASPCPHPQLVGQSHVALVERDPDSGWRLWHELTAFDKPIHLSLGL